MKILLFFICFSFLSGFLVSYIVFDDGPEKITKSYQKSTKNTKIYTKYVMLPDGSLECPAEENRQVLVVNKLNCPFGCKEQNNFIPDDVYEELDACNEKYNSVLTFCDPACTEMLTDCNLELDRLKRASYSVDERFFW
jgi:hypothetical protein